MRARTRRSLGSYTSVVCLHSSSSLALLFLSDALFLTWTFKHFDLEQHFDSCARCYHFFFSQKEYPPGSRFPLSHTHPKNRLRILEFLLHTRHTLPIVVAIFWTILPHLFLSFCLCFLSFFFFFFSFLTTRKRKFALSEFLSLFSSRVCS